MSAFSAFFRRVIDAARGLFVRKRKGKSESVTQESRIPRKGWARAGEPKCQKCGGWLTPFISAGKVERLCIQCQAATGAFGKPQLGSMPPSSPPLPLAAGSADAQKRKFTLGPRALLAAAVHAVVIVVTPFVVIAAAFDAWLRRKTRKFPEAHRIMRGIACAAIGAAFGAWLGGIFVSILFGWICAALGFHDYRPLPEGGHDAFVKPGDKSDFKEAPIVRNFRAEIQDKVMGADKTARESEYPIAAMHVAAQRDSAAVIAALVERGDDINARNHAGWTPLHYAKYYRARSAYAALVERGADEHAKAKDGETPRTLMEKMPGFVRPMTDDERMQQSPEDSRRRTPARW